MPTITMEATDVDKDNAKTIKSAIGAPNNAVAVSVSLAKTKEIIDGYQKGGTLFMEQADGTVSVIVFAELEAARPVGHNRKTRASPTVN